VLLVGAAVGGLYLARRRRQRTAGVSSKPPPQPRQHKQPPQPGGDAAAAIDDGAAVGFTDNPSIKTQGKPPQTATVVPIDGGNVAADVAARAAEATHLAAQMAFANKHSAQSSGGAAAEASRRNQAGDGEAAAAATAAAAASNRNLATSAEAARRHVTSAGKSGRAIVPLPASLTSGDAVESSTTRHSGPAKNSRSLATRRASDASGATTTTGRPSRACIATAT
jgi:hypothetical protein